MANHKFFSGIGKSKKGRASRGVQEIPFRSGAARWPAQPFPVRSWLALLWVPAFLLVMLSSVYAIYARFLPSIDYLRMMDAPATVLAVVLTAPIALVIPLLWRTLRPRWMAWLSPLILIVLFFVVEEGILSGPPALLHWISRVPGEQRLVVEHRQSRYYRRRRCRGGVYVVYPVLKNAQVCGIDEARWKRIEPGDELILSGSVSYFGIAYEAYEIVKCASCPVGPDTRPANAP